MIGSERMRLPVAAKIAFATAAATGGVAGSPAPPQISAAARHQMHVDLRRLGKAHHAIGVEIALHRARRP